MPVVVELLGPNLTEQDRQDLLKIYADAPEGLLTSEQSITTLIEQASQATHLLGARFNSRLLGAAVLKPEATHWTLSHLCVRALTRRRGVGSRLLDEATRLATEAGFPLQLQGVRNELGVLALIERAQKA
ncbi:acetyltransferase (GNAT) family protein [Azomonas agilis]|uniref:Acetyltransferase (GNAT) family protein n=1 Tax=Azomonas agilis TaxID=116849 RepID=A0A562IKI6_9GAMM|nr:acetyl-CoA sensor PanZ family protein [Azomonas agilis]TWH71398.1 acetyltransferase (GNAT) family protein [Azomonas agilis]